jgi:hypothetical protein
MNTVQNTTKTPVVLLGADFEGTRLLVPSEQLEKLANWGFIITEDGVVEAPGWEREVKMGLRCCFVEYNSGNTNAPIICFHFSRSGDGWCFTKFTFVDKEGKVTDL